MRLDRWFRRRYPDLPQTHLNKIVRKGEVRVDGKRVEISTRLEAGQSVRVPPLNLPAARAKDEPAPINPADAQALRDMILFEDRDVLVLNKPYGLAVQGGSGTKRHIDGMLAALADKHGQRPVLVHRLDRDTSGVLLCAKNRKMAADLGAVFRSRGARKIYWALVEGVPKPAQGRISMFLAKGEGMGDDRGARREHADLERMRVARHGDPEAQHSLTMYATVDKVPPQARLAFAAPDHRAHPPIARALRGDRPSDHRRSQIQPPARERSGPQRSVARRAAGGRAQAASARSPSDPAASQGRNDRRHRAAAAAYEEEFRYVRLRAART